MRKTSDRFLLQNKTRKFFTGALAGSRYTLNGASNLQHEKYEPLHTLLVSNLHRK